jgi:hypothetical protein
MNYLLYRPEYNFKVTRSNILYNGFLLDMKNNPTKIEWQTYWLEYKTPLIINLHNMNLK